jgi:pentatricopeptide repeat protein
MPLAHVNEGMNDLVDIMKACDATPDLYTYSTLLNAYARQGDADSCQRVIQEMLQRRVQPLVLPCFHSVIDRGACVRCVCACVSCVCVVCVCVCVVRVRVCV